jgi:hypothetical protein
MGHKFFARPYPPAWTTDIEFNFGHDIAIIFPAVYYGPISTISDIREKENITGIIAEGIYGISWFPFYDLGGESAPSYIGTTPFLGESHGDIHGDKQGKTNGGNYFIHSPFLYKYVM